MNKSAEVVVVGGGVTGCSIAYYLAREGADVVLIEKGELASGASGACFGGLAAITAGPPMIDFIIPSKKLYPNLEKELEYDIEYERCGSAILLNNEDQWPAIRERAKELQKKGVKVRLIEEDEMRGSEPALAGSVIGALTCPEDGCVNPIRTCNGFARAAKRLGAEIHTFTELRDIKVRNGKVRSALTNSGEIKTDFVVNAAGAWAPFIGEMVGLKIPVSPLRGQVVVSERLPLFRWRYLVEAELVTKDLLHPKNKESKGHAFAFLQYREGNCLIGSTADFPGYDRRTTPEAIELILKRAVRFIPQLENVSFIRTYAGLRPYSDDGLPIWGEVKGVDGFVLAAGQGSRGNCLSPLTGKLISELITKGKTSMPIDKFRYSRFEHTNCSITLSN